MSTAAERQNWMEMFKETGSAAQVCARFAVSYPTFRKWRRRFEAAGISGLEEPSRAPARSPNRKIFAPQEALILELRRVRRLGVHRLRTELREHHGVDISADTILRILRRAGEPPLRTARADPMIGSGARTADAAPSPALPHDGASAQIAELITTGVLRPGEKLSETMLGRRLGVGRTLVREALKQLAVGGLVVLQRHRGAFVAQPSLTQIEQAYAARRLIEGAIIADVCTHCTAHDIRLLRRHLDQQIAANVGGQRRTFVKLLTEFHLVIASLGENRILETMLAELTARTSLAVMIYDHGGEPSCAIEEHAELIELLAAGDAAGATTLMTRHLTTNQQRLEAGT